MKKIELISFDPGVSTGYCRLIYYPEIKELHIVELAVFKYYSKIPMLLRTYPDAIVITEDFYARLLNANLTPVKVNGILDYLCDKQKRQLFLQQPAFRKQSEMWFSKLKDQTHFPSHSGSALRHGIFFIVKHFCKKGIPKLVYNYKELMESLNKS